MQQKALVRGARRPGGRTEAVRQSVGQAVLDLLDGGNNQFSMAEVAERAGVHRSTLYRRWETRAALIREAMALRGAKLKIPNTGSWEGDLRLMIADVAGFLGNPVEQALISAMLLPDNRLLVEELIQAWKPVLTMRSSPIQRAVARGEVASDIDPGFVMSLVLSPLLLYALAKGDAPPPAYQQRLVDSVLMLTGCPR